MDHHGSVTQLGDFSRLVVVMGIAAEEVRITMPVPSLTERLPYLMTTSAWQLQCH